MIYVRSMFRYTYIYIYIYILGIASNYTFLGTNRSEKSSKDENNGSLKHMV